MKHLLRVLLSFILLIVPLYAVDTGYNIESYKVKIQVGEDNVFSISEDINVDFLKQSHGIYRRIPIKNNVTHVDDTISMVIANIEDIRVNTVATFFTEGNYKVVKIGDPEVFVIGKQYYKLTYSYDLGKDVRKNYDEFYFNIIGDEWDANIGSVDFEIEMPKAFDTNRINFSVGARGSTTNEGVYYEVDGNNIKGYYEKSLQPGEGLTIRIVLPEGYFTATRNNTDRNIQVDRLIIIPIVTLIVILLIWILFARNLRERITEYSYPPQGLNSVEVGMLYKGKAGNKEVISLLLGLAQKGYLKIIDLDEIGSKKKNANSFEIHKLKDYDGTDKVEEIFFKGLFRRRNRVNEEKLRNSFYKTVNKVKDRMNKGDKRAQWFKKSGYRAKVIATILAFLSYASITYMSFIDGARLDLVIETVMIVVVGIMILTLTMSKQKGLYNGIFIIGASIFWSMSETLFLVSLTIDYRELIPAALVNQLCSVMMFIVIWHMIKRTSHGQELYLEIKGFKKYLENIDDREIESLKQRDKNYFGDLLAYMMVLNISQRTIEKFNEFTQESPSWYEGKSFNSHEFINRLYNIIYQVENAMISQPRDYTGDSIGTGGGSSGGGSGGGGGSSW